MRYTNITNHVISFPRRGKEKRERERTRNCIRGDPLLGTIYVPRGGGGKEGVKRNPLPSIFRAPSTRDPIKRLTKQTKGRLSWLAPSRSRCLSHELRSPEESHGSPPPPPRNESLLHDLRAPPPASTRRRKKKNSLSLSLLFAPRHEIMIIVGWR